MKKNIVLFLVLSLVLLSFTDAFAQKQKTIGVNLSVVNNPAGLWENSLDRGLFYEYQFAKHFAVNFGFNYRTSYFTEDLFSFNYNYLTIPVGVKFTSRIVNFSIGPNIIFFLDWVDNSGNIDSVSIGNDTMDVGAFINIGKDIKLNDRFILEPYIAGELSLLYNAYIGLGIRLKYNL